MSSEAAYFPDAVASAAEAPEVVGDHHASLVHSLEGAPAGIAAAFPRVSATSDESLMTQVRDGVKEALALLFRRHARSVRNVAYRILRNEAEADDLVQEVFLFIFRKAALYDSAQGSTSTWIIHVTYHRAFDRRRYLNTRHFYSSQELDDTSLRLADQRRQIPFHEQSMEGILGKPLMARFNARLTPEQRETIQLFFFEGYSLKEIAEFTGRSLVNVRSHYYRGVERMRKYVLPEKVRSK
ncbi:MAG TPA: sigma-70 family RNA polymerase sigma factor [Terracidiphilus sp.]|jgi:RNA polymerase sigma-70 factor (ECF subfamily)